MKKIITACMMLIAILYVYGNIAFADDCVMGRKPEGVYPMKNEDIIMESEDIKVYPYEGRAECTFQFLNTGKERDILMGFPNKRVPDPDIWEPENLIIKDFTASDENGNLSVSKDNAVKPPRSFDNRFDEYSSWFTFKVHFKKGERKTIKNTYKFSLSYYSNGELMTGYIIKTGSLWKDKIGNARVTFYMPGLKPYNINSLYGGPYFSFEQDKIVWQRSNFEPDEDLEIYFIRFDELIKNTEETEFKNGLKEMEKELADQLNEINSMGIDELIKLLDFENYIKGGLRLAAYERLLKSDWCYGNRIFMKIGKNRATINGINESFDYAAPEIFENRTFVPLRFIIENFGGDIQWNGKLQEITIENNHKKIKMKIGQKSYSLDGKTKSMDAAPRIVDGRTLVPLRFISESMGYDVKWFDMDKSILISYIKSKSEQGFTLMEEEALGGLALGTEDKECIKLIGEPERKSDLIVWGADGLEHQSWFYLSKGIELDMVRTDGWKQAINRITIEKPCSFKTKRNIGIGSSKKDVLDAYKDFFIDENEIDGNKIILGTIYGGITMFLENDIVKQIYIGANAE